MYSSDFSILALTLTIVAAQIGVLCIYNLQCRWLSRRAWTSLSRISKRPYVQTLNFKHIQHRVSWAFPGYLLPNDDVENERLDIHHELMLAMLNGKLHLAPILENIQKAIDLGTGTGIWAIDFGEFNWSVQWSTNYLPQNSRPIPLRGGKYTISPNPTSNLLKPMQVVGNDLSPIQPPLYVYLLSFCP